MVKGGGGERRRELWEDARVVWVQGGVLQWEGGLLTLGGAAASVAVASRRAPRSQSDLILAVVFGLMVNYVLVFVERVSNMDNTNILSALYFCGFGNRYALCSAHLPYAPGTSISSH